MRARITLPLATTMIAALAFVGIGAYFWPVSTSFGCPRMSMTAAQMRDGAYDIAVILAAEESSQLRYECLQHKLDVALEPWPSPLNYVQYVFLTNDLKALDSAATTAFVAHHQATSIKQARTGSTSSEM